ncbi:hypothetical protein PHYBLDRAFT_71921 [Phycomyces blakesleeanus NRRL 1555(-)]|uniref:Uncharacterized protein n=1 Tax=Phycomyces blakesleeanus (strain ATCC 8743b / DSM 1359 / FGSC 10004 / NBRC 33097 / NRRL 1555) TaxID=763407 RepID=A0A167JT22_PHYB8|nr:hypothetical protein PHYBLDRAFT_71921 [Phycomyces blakesleeanus NRRL 1555(-)]OAD66648.1 hypothetical protein PHYBLDRAFT_71921 [Phycomyces blakesleeanus NRRL 1555(-)]|eukprot:XP_018284688.1 hypothetical protein PHYBLDRAFT_71921 [Phycomyces blakesleeanus NRRL 1555(-)]
MNQRINRYDLYWDRDSSLVKKQYPHIVYKTGIRSIGCVCAYGKSLLQGVLSSKMLFLSRQLKAPCITCFTLEAPFFVSGHARSHPKTFVLFMSAHRLYNRI